MEARPQAVWRERDQTESERVSTEAAVGRVEAAAEMVRTEAAVVGRWRRQWERPRQESEGETTSHWSRRLRRG